MDLLLMKLDPVAFELGSIKVRWYGILIVTGIIIAYFVAQKEGEKRGLDKEFFTDLLIWAVPISIICARIYYVGMRWNEYYGSHPEDIIKIWEGGIAIHGALIGAFLTGYVFCKKRGVSFLKVADIAAPSILIGQIVGRWGNFVNQEAFGGPVSREFLENLMLPDWIIEQMYIEQLQSYVHPTFLYESMWNLLGLILLLIFRKVNLHRGEIFLSYLIWYSIGRFFVESLRTDSLYFMGLKAAQFVSVSAIVISVIVLIYRRVKVRPVVRYLEKNNK